MWKQQMARQAAEGGIPLPTEWDVYRETETGLGRVELLLSRPEPDCPACAAMLVMFCRRLQQNGVLQSVTGLFASERLTEEAECFHICCVDFWPGEALQGAKEKGAEPWNRTNRKERNGNRCGKMSFPAE